MQDKLIKAFQAETTAGRANYLIDAISEEGSHDQAPDSILHTTNEVGLASVRSIVSFRRGSF